MVAKVFTIKESSCHKPILSDIAESTNTDMCDFMN